MPLPEETMCMSLEFEVAAVGMLRPQIITSKATLLIAPVASPSRLHLCPHQYLIKALAACQTLSEHRRFCALKGLIYGLVPERH